MQGTIKKISLIAIAGFTCAMASGQTAQMSLNDCMRYAISNSTQIRIRNAEAGDAKIARREAILGAFVPTVSAGTYAYYNFGRNVDPETNIYTNTTSFHNGYSLSSGISLFNGFQAVNNLKISKTSLAICGDQKAQAESDICLATMEAYYNFVYYSKLADIMQAQAEAAEANCQLLERQEQLGQKGYADVVQAKAELADRRYDHTNTANMRNDALMKLQDIMFWPADSLLLVDMSCVATDAPAELTDTENIVDYAKDNNPAARVARGNMENAKAELSTARWQLTPKLDLYAGWNTNYFSYPGKDSSVSSYSSQFKNNGGEYIQLSLSIPIFDRFSAHGRISRKKNAYAKATAEYDGKLREIESEVRRAVQDRDGAEAAYAQAEVKADLQQEAYALNSKKYEQGLISSLEYQTASNNYLQAQADRLGAMFKYLIKNSVVRYYNGTDYIDQ